MSFWCWLSTSDFSGPEKGRFKFSRESYLRITISTSPAGYCLRAGSCLRVGSFLCSGSRLVGLNNVTGLVALLGPFGVSAVRFAKALVSRSSLCKLLFLASPYRASFSANRICTSILGPLYVVELADPFWLGLLRVSLVISSGGEFYQWRKFWFWWVIAFLRVF